MKSSHKNSPLSNVFSGFALALVAVVGFFTVGTMLPKQQSQEAVLGTTTGGYDATFSIGNNNYVCKTAFCGERRLSSTVCLSLKDSNGQSTCKWNSVASASANTTKCTASTAYKYGTSTKAYIYRALLKKWPGVNANNVPYNCLKITGNPTCTVGLGKACGIAACSNHGTAMCAKGLACYGLRCVKTSSIPGSPVGGDSTSTTSNPKPTITPSIPGTR